MIQGNVTPTGQAPCLDIGYQLHQYTLRLSSWAQRLGNSSSTRIIGAESKHPDAASSSQTPPRHSLENSLTLHGHSWNPRGPSTPRHSTRRANTLSWRSAQEDRVVGSR